MQLFFIRHGESENNFNRCYSGQCNPHLTALGREQAKAVRPILEGINFDAVYSSDLLRARETCSIALPGVEPILTPKIREMAIGALENQPYYISKGEDDEYGKSLAANRADFNYAPYGGENIDDVKKRIDEFLKELEGKSYKNVAAFCHAGFMSVALSHILGMKVDRDALLCPNCTVSVFDYNGSKWRLSCWNYGAKLGEASE